MSDELSVQLLGGKVHSNLGYEVTISNAGAKFYNPCSLVNQETVGPFLAPWKNDLIYIDIRNFPEFNSCVENFSDYLKHWPPPLTTHYHADGAKELIGAEIKRLCENFSPAIELTYSTAYSPNENSYAERAWRTLADMAHPI
jgi:hypothetical protein